MGFEKSTIENLLIELVKENTSAFERLKSSICTESEQLKRIDTSVKDFISQGKILETKLGTVSKDLDSILKDLREISRSIKGLLLRVIVVAGVVSGLSFVLGYLVR